MRLLRRNAGSLGTADLIVVVLVADAAQNGMAGEYKPITEGIVIKLGSDEQPPHADRKQPS
jgi:hypothetical protein